MKTATVANIKSHISALLTDVEAGQEIVITRRGRPIAWLIPEPRDIAPFDWESVEALVESDPSAPGATVADLRERDLL